MNDEHSVAKLRGCITNTERPAQRYDASKLPETAFGTQVGDDPTAVGTSFLFAPDAEFGVADSDLDLIRAHAREFDANRDQLFRFAQIDWRRPRA
jgi:hypothetical protein